MNAFPVDGRYLFRHYFEGDRLFARLREYYENRQYRFAVPAGEFADVRRFLGERGYWLVVVDDPAEFVVAVRQYTAHPDGIFEHSVLQRARDGHNLFLLKDAEAVGEMAAAGATPLPETDLAVPFDTSVAADTGAAAADGEEPD